MASSTALGCCRRIMLAVVVWLCVLGVRGCVWVCVGVGECWVARAVSHAHTPVLISGK